VLVSGIFRANQPFFAWYGSIWRKMLDAFTCFFVQNESSKQLLESLSLEQRISVTGDTRFDRVIAIAEHAESVPFVAEFCGHHPVIVAGSTWREDEIELSHFVKVHPEIKFIIAPHEIDDLHLEEIKKIFPHSIFYSELVNISGNPVTPVNVLIMNNMGMLSRVYQYADIAYVGGGFGKDGVHNVLEPAVYGKPVVFGPEYEKFDEAVGLLEAGAALSYGDPMGLENLLQAWLQDENLREQNGKAAKEFVYAKTGATQQILQYIQENRLLTN
jgi:3-deoxy-D-manno-octulosonic-acid transferase